ncbi:cytochrome C [Pseudomonas sp. LA21]|uniref:cytochrome C n=1 Tax=unclassified Pseudomonas TaxID=196821 RepID=UPI001FB667B9|nr:cytochrome C [Pseudomonas sp. LA21]MCJ1885999.1 cytochrome C [Pseudomonas sp. LA21]
MPSFLRVGALSGCLCLPILTLPAPSSAADTDPLQRGRYLVQIAGCNDCHTPGYAMAPEKVPESTWLTGDQLGWSGPWGTTYPANLRLYMQGRSEEQWLATARQANFRPPMPSYVLRVMNEDDLRSIYRFVRQLGPAGEVAPAYLPPGSAPKGPAVVFPSPPTQ